MDKDFLDQYNKFLSRSETLYEKIVKIIKEKKMPMDEFYNATELNRNIIYDMKRNPSRRPQLRTIVTICVGLCLEPIESMELIEFSGYKLSKSRIVDYAYCDILHNFYEFGVEECNNRLEEIGIEEKYYLGSRQFK